MDQQEWTIMVYMAGDNNLSVDMAYAMEQIKQVATTDTDSVNLFVYYDGASASIPTLYCDFSDSMNPIQLRSFKVQDKLFAVEEKENENAADYRSIANFVDWCVNKVERVENDEVVCGRRARRYAMIFSGHSMGFEDKGLFKDESSDKTMTMQQLSSLLERLTKSEEELIAKGNDQDPEFAEAGDTVVIGQKLDILGFDSCVMGMLEVGSQFSSVAKTMIASEGSVPNAGWSYAKILGNLAHNSDNLPVTDITANFVSDFVRSQDSYTIGGVSVDMAAWDFSRLSRLNDAFEELAAALADCFADPDSKLYKQMERVMLQVHWKCQTYMFDQNVDLGDMCNLILEQCGSLKEEVGGEIIPSLEKIENSCKNILHELENTVILSGFSGGMYQFSNGISVFWPWSAAAYDVSQKNYEELKFVKDSGAGQKWNDFLKKFVHQVTFRDSLEPTVDRDTFEPIIPESMSQDAGADVIAYSDPQFRPVYRTYEYQDESAEFVGLAVKANGKMGGTSGSKMGGTSGSKMGGTSGSKMGGTSGSKMGGTSGSKMGGTSGSKMGGTSGSKMGGTSGSKMGGTSGSKMGGTSGSKMGGTSGSKMGGTSGPKMGGTSGSKMGGTSGSKMGGGGSSDAFFNSMQGFKNAADTWNIAGFTKQPPKSVEKLKSKKTSTS